MPNRLIHETSPYLLQHANNPVDWYPWGEEALAEARRRNVPILLSVGYSSCHWCHVMERESFENAIVAARMNSLFVNVKVDREERPDIDELYMRAVQAFNRGHGGWPMTVFLTPDGVPFFGGTYFPPTSRGSMPGLVDVLTHVSELWRKEQGSAGELSKITEQVRALLEQGATHPTAGRWLSNEWLPSVAAACSRDFDAVEGGFGDAPKFPPHGALPALLAHHRRTGEARSLEMVTITLDGMSRGGLYDLLGGGFCRYSVDEEWRVPHFEKMLYDNAQLVPVYVDAARITGSARYARIARETIEFVLREMALPGGGFASSFDADSGDGPHREEGAYYVFDRAELTSALGHLDGVRAADLLEVTTEGTFEHGKSVLRLATPLEDLDPADRELLVERAFPKLRALRDQRPRPERDDKRIVSWNALMISALARAGAAMGEERWILAGEEAARFLLDQLRHEGRWYRTFLGTRGATPAFADDHANLLLAFLDLYEARSVVPGAPAEPWLAEALDVADQIVALFWDGDNGGLWQVGRDQPPLVARSRPAVGGAEPGATGTTALGFVRLGRLAARDDLTEIADQLLRGAQGYLARAARALGTEALAGAWLAEGGAELAIAGDPAAADTAALLAEIRKRFLPFTVVARVPPEGTAAWPWLEGKTALRGRATAFLCEGHSCQLPTSDPAEFGVQLDDWMRRTAPSTTTRQVRVHAPELPQDPASWLGVDGPLSLEQLRGRIVVLDFWTYCCINCLHVLPELAAIEERYRDKPVVVIGVHCAKFPTEQIVDNVRQAMLRHHVHHPVVCDPDHEVWEQYAVRSWPTLVVLDGTGRVAFHQAGEIDRDSLAQVIDGLLAELEGPTAPMILPISTEPAIGEELKFPGKVHVWPDAFEQEMGLDPFVPGSTSPKVYVADTGHHRILELALARGPDGWPTLTRGRVFGSGSPGMVDGPSGIASFRGPQGIRRMGTTLYVADTENHAVRSIDLTDGTVRTLAGTGHKATTTPSRSALATPLAVDLRSPWDVEVMAFRSHHLVFVAMAGNHQIWVYGPQVGHIGIHAGSGREDHVDGPAASSALAQPSALALLGRYLLFADSETSSIRAVDLQSHHVVTVVGRGLFDFGDADGPADAVRLQHPLGITFAEDTVYVADTFNHKIKAIGLASGETVTLVGGDPSVLREPGGIARAGDFLIVADTGNHRLRAVKVMTGEIRDLPIG